MTKEEQWQKLLGYILGFQATWIIDIGKRAGLFQAIHEAGDGVTAEALAARLGLHPPYMAVWCRAAYAHELLEHEESSGYRLAPHMPALLLDPQDPLYLAGRAQFVVATGEDFGIFADRLRDGAPFPRGEHAPWLLAALRESSKPDFPNMTEQVIAREPRLRQAVEAGGRILDVGCGAGYGLLHFARTYPRARLLGLEPEPHQLALARQQVEEAGLQDRVECRALDANHLDYEGEFDLVYMNIALHETGGPAEFRNVLTRCRRALKDGGHCLVSELPYPGTVREYRQHPVYKLLAGIQVHEILVGCGMITIPELEGLLREAGFCHIRRCEQPNPGRVMFLAQR